MSRLSRCLPWLSLAPALALWFAQARYGLAAGFFPDDAMNLLGAFRLDWHHVLLDPLWPASGAYRPLGALYYRALFEWFGFTPAPFHAVAFAIQAANLTVLWALARRLAGGWEAAALTALFASFHVYLSDIYASTGTIYDQLCFLFFYLALLLRPHSRIAFTACAVLAVNSKEPGVLLPAVVLMEDLLLRGWRKIDWRSILLSGVVSAAFLSRSFVLAGEAAGAEAYTPRLEWGRVSGNLAGYFGLLFLRPGALNADQAFTICALLAGGAAALRNRVAWFGLAVFALGLGPALLLPIRSLYMLYVPMGGLALALGVAASEGLRRLPVPPPLRVAVAALLFAALWIPLHARFRESSLTWVRRDGPVIGQFASAIREAYPALPRGARVLFVKDTFTPDDFLIEMTMQLLYRDTTLYVQRVARIGSMPDEAIVRSFPYVLEYDGTRVRPVQSEGSRTQSSGRPALQ